MAGLLDLMSPIGSIVGSVANVGMQAYTNYQNNKTAQKINESNQKFALQQQQMQNQYNSPQNQVDMLEKAGLNPALVYGQGGSNPFIGSADATAGGTAQMPSPSVAPQVDATGVGSSFEQKRLADAQINLMQKQANSLEKNTSWIDRLNTKTLEQIDSSIKKNNAEVDKIISSIRIDDLNVEDLQKKIEVYTAQMPALKEREDLANQLTRANIKVSEKQVEQIAENIKLVKQQILYQQIVNKYADRMEQAKLNELNQRITESKERVAQGWKKLELEEKGQTYQQQVQGLKTMVDFMQRRFDNPFATEVPVSDDLLRSFGLDDKGIEHFKRTNSNYSVDDGLGRAEGQLSSAFSHVEGQVTEVFKVLLGIFEFF